MPAEGAQPRASTQLAIGPPVFSLARRVVAPPAHATSSAWDPNDTKSVLDLKWVGIYRQDADTTRVSITFWNPVRDWMLRRDGAGGTSFALSSESLGMLTTMVGGYVHQLWAGSVWSPRVACHVVRRRVERGPRATPRGAPEPLHPPGVASQLARHGCPGPDSPRASAGDQIPSTGWLIPTMPGAVSP